MPSRVPPFPFLASFSPLLHSLCLLFSRRLVRADPFARSARVYTWRAEHIRARYREWVSVRGEIFWEIEHSSRFPRVPFYLPGCSTPLPTKVRSVNLIFLYFAREHAEPLDYVGKYFRAIFS